MDREMNSALDGALKDEYNFDAGAQGMKGENCISKRGSKLGPKAHLQTSKPKKKYGSLSTTLILK